MKRLENGFVALSDVIHQRDSSGKPSPGHSSSLRSLQLLYELLAPTKLLAASWQAENEKNLSRKTPGGMPESPTGFPLSARLLFGVHYFRQEECLG